MFENKTDTMLLRTLNLVLPTSPLAVEAAGQRYIQAMLFLYLGGLIDANADIMPEIKRRIRLTWACYDRFKRELCDMEDTPFMLKVRLLNTEVMETLLYRCVTWALGLQHIARLRTDPHNLLLSKDHWLSAPTAHRLRRVVRQGSQEGTM